MSVSILTGVAALPANCVHPDACTQGSCRAVAERYLGDMAARQRALKAMTAKAAA